ncbi:Tol-Pal system beta propeller repeat protein TolB [Burkholderiales bacterium]|nr:Tol-Pal system beta propeller repeat protein TolB [Burkholderiales bacterium]
MFSIFRIASVLAKIMCLSTALFCGVASSQVEVEIIADEGSKIPITVLPFEGDGKARLMSEIISADLMKTGLFAIQDVKKDWGRNKLNESEYSDWDSRDVQNLVVGKFIDLDDGRIQGTFWLYDIPGQAMSVGYQIKDDPTQIRRMAHHFADLIYEKITGDKGVFRTKITYVVRAKDQSTLVIADSDGHNPKEIFSTNEPILSPRWSPDGGQIAFVSFLNRKAAVHVLPVDYDRSRVTGKPRIIGPYPGSNSAPAWSPDGKSLAITISKDGKSNIFIVSLEDETKRQITNSRSINTEPSFSSDGKNIVFTSDRTGRPQIYQTSVRTVSEVRLTFEGRYNASPQFSADDAFVALIHYDERKFNVGTLDMKSGVVEILTNGSLDQSPSISPNGKVIVYASEANGRGILRFVSKNGRAKLRYVGPEGDDIREPSWGPFIKD